MAISLGAGERPTAACKGDAYVALALVALHRRSSTAGEESDQRDEPNGAQDRDQNGVDQSTLTGEPEFLHDPAADQSADDPEHNVQNGPVPRAPHDLARCPSGDEADDDPPEQIHG